VLVGDSNNGKSNFIKTLFSACEKDGLARNIKVVIKEGYYFNKDHNRNRGILLQFEQYHQIVGYSWNCKHD